MNLAVALRTCAIDENGRVADAAYASGVGGALAAELVLAGRIRLEEEGVFLLDRTPIGDDLLDPVLADFDEEGFARTRATWFISALGQASFARVHERMVEEGLVTVVKGEKRRFWVDKPDWSRIEPPGEQVRLRLQSILRGQAEPDARERVLAGLVWACDLVNLHVPSEEKTAATARAEALAQDAAVPEHVREAIKGSRAATGSLVNAAQG